jgi:hypothetical protein
LATCTTFWESLTPSKRRTAAYIALATSSLREGESLRPRLELINEGEYEGLQRLEQLPRNPKRRSSHNTYSTHSSE